MEPKLFGHDEGIDRANLSVADAVGSALDVAAEHALPTWPVDA